jgi:hypothetical protein
VLDALLSATVNLTSPGYYTVCYSSDNVTWYEQAPELLVYGMLHIRATSARRGSAPTGQTWWQATVVIGVYANPVFVTHLLIWIADEGQQAIFGITPDSTFVDTPVTFTVVGADSGRVGFTSDGDCFNPVNPVCHRGSCVHVAILRKGYMCVGP